MNKFITREWDSAFFNRTILSLELSSSESKLESWPRESLVKVKVDAKDYQNLNFLNNNSFNFVEGELLFQKDLAKRASAITPADIKNYVASEATIEELKTIVSNLYKNSRFRGPWFTSKERDDFYQKWVENAVLSKHDDCCLILKVEGDIAAFVTVRVTGFESKIGLVGVTPSFQGQGFGKKLLELAESYCISKNSTKLLVATQISNVSAANLYIKTGFVLADTSYWFYK